MQATSSLSRAGTPSCQRLWRSVTTVDVRRQVRYLRDLLHIGDYTASVALQAQAFLAQVLYVLIIVRDLLQKIELRLCQFLHLSGTLTVSQDSLRVGLNLERIVRLGDLIAFEGHYAAPLAQGWEEVGLADTLDGSACLRFMLLAMTRYVPNVATSSTTSHQVRGCVQICLAVDVEILKVKLN